MESNPSGFRILVVDDECIIADTLALIFRAKGYESAPAYDGESALNLAISFLPDIVLTDVMMPGMDGVTLGIRIRQSYPDCRVILSSGQVGAKNLLREAEAQGYSFELLEKPFHPDEILRRVAKTSVVPSARRRPTSAPGESVPPPAKKVV